MADVLYKTCRDPNVIPIDIDPYDVVYKNLTIRHFVLRKVPMCEYCGAKRFLGEGPGFCCRKGKVNIFSAPIPGGETGWEDKSILLEQNPVICFPRKKRSYTK